MAILICVTCGAGFHTADTKETECFKCKELTPYIHCKECNRIFEPTNDHARGMCPACEIHICTGIGFDSNIDRCPACEAGTAEKSALKVYLVLVSFDGPDDGPISDIEMTILHTTQATALHAVSIILEQDGYKIDGANIVVREIDGPFKAGFVIARHGG